MVLALQTDLMRTTPAVSECNSSGILCVFITYLVRWKKRGNDREGVLHLFSKYVNLFAKCHFETE